MIIEKMLKERVATSILDSGGTPKYVNGCYVGSSGGYGRAFERNQCRNFEAERPAALSFRYGVEVTLNLYHWLAERVDYSELDRVFHEMYEPDTDEGASWFALVEEFPEWLRERGIDPTGLYGEGDPFTVNTYNHNSLLSQTVQFLYMELDGEIDVPWQDEPLYLSGEYYLLQIHNGADVRGGYTKPRGFESNGSREFALLDSAQAMISCQNDHRWWTDDGYHWYGDNTRDKELGDFPSVEYDEQVDVVVDISTAVAQQYGLDEALHDVVERSSIEAEVPAKYAQEYGKALAGIVNAYASFGAKADLSLWDEGGDKLQEEFIVSTEDGGLCPCCQSELEVYG